MKDSVKLSKGQTILFTGDSITDAGRRKAEYAPMGQGYAHFAANLLTARHPSMELNILNTGISGDTTRSLLARWQSDCIDLSPNVLSILIGINDLWRQHRGRLDEAVLPDEYEENFRKMLTAVRDACNPQIVLIEPFMFCDDHALPMFAGLPTYIKIVRQLAKDYNAILVPLQTMIEKQIGQVPPAKWSADFVHPAIWTHAWIAERWLESTGL